jgi:hypothetical protein
VRPSIIERHTASGRDANRGSGRTVASIRQFGTPDNTPFSAPFCEPVPWRKCLAWRHDVYLVAIEGPYYYVDWRLCRKGQYQICYFLPNRQ